MLVESLKVFLGNSQKILLLRGSAGSGKTFYCKQLITQLASDVEYQTITAIYISLNKDKSIIEHAVTEQKVATNQKLLFILDGYEELGELQNIYQYFNLARWPNAKVIVTCRPEYFANVGDYRVYFAPLVRERFEFHLLEEVALTADIDSLLSTCRDKPPATLIAVWDAHHQVKYKLTAEQKKQILEYCIAIAQEMQKQGVTKIVYRPTSGLFNRSGNTWQKYFAATLTAMRMCAPIIKTGKYQYEFIDSNLITYFATMKPEVQTQAIEKQQDNNAKEDQKQMATKTLQQLSNHYLNFRLITRDVNMLNLLADRVWQSQRFKMELFDLILASRADEKMAVAAANAITILNMAKVPFSGMDLSGVRVPKANLTNGIFDQTNLNSAILDDVEMTNAFLGLTLLRGSRLKGIEFRERPYLELKGYADKMVVSPDGRWLAVSWQDVSVWSLSSFELITILKREESRVLGSYEFNYNGNLFVSTYVMYSGRGDSILKFLDLETKTVVSVVTYEHHITKVAFSKNDLYFLTLATMKNGSNVLAVWSIDKNKIQPVSQKIFNNDENTIYFDICHQTHYLATSSYTDITIWQFPNFERIHCVAASKKNSWEVRAILFRKSNSHLISINRNGVMMIWDTTTGTLVQKMTIDQNLVRTGWINSIRFDREGKRFATQESLEKNKIKIWSVETDERNIVVHSDSSSMSDFAFSPNQQYLLTVGFDEFKVRIRKIVTDDVLQPSQPEYSKIVAIGIMLQARCFYLLDREGVLQTWCTHTHKLLLRERLVKTGYVSLYHIASFSINSKWLAVVVQSNRMIIYAMQPRQFGIKHYSFDEIVGSIKEIFFSADENNVAAYSEDEMLIVYDLTRGIKRSTIKGVKKDYIRTVAFSSDAQQILAIDYNAALRVYDIETGVVKHYQDVNPSLERYVALSADGKFLVFHTAKQIILRNMLEKRDYCLEQAAEGKECNVKSVHFSNDNQYLAVCRSYRITTIFYLKYKKITNIFGWLNSPDITCFSQDGQYLITASESDSVRVFQLFKTLDGNEQWLLQQHLPPRLSCWNCDVETATNLDFLPAGVLKQRGATGLANFDPLLANRATLLNVLKQRVENDPKQSVPVNESKVVTMNTKQIPNKSSTNRTVISMLLASSLIAARQLTTPNAHADQQSDIHRRLQNGFLGRMTNSLFSAVPNNVPITGRSVTDGGSDEDKKANSKANDQSSTELVKK